MRLQTTYAETGMNEFDNRVTQYVSAFRKIEFDFSEIGANDEYLVPVPAGTYVLGVGLHITEAFDVATAVIVGIDGGDTDAFIATGVVDPAVLDSFALGRGGGAALALGAYYPDGAVIAVAFNGNPTAGKGIVLLETLNLTPSWRAAL